jgi:hypothetical protein
VQHIYHPRWEETRDELLMPIVSGA